MAKGIGRRAGARTLLIERKGYPGGTVVEGGTALHSYFTVCCMGQGQAAGTAAALCAAKSCGTRELAYPLLREALLKAGVHLEG